MIKGAIFDVDGTLLDSMQVWDHVGEQYLRTIGITAGPGLGETMFPMTMKEGAAYIKKTYNLQCSTGEIIDGINAVIWEFYAKEVPLKEGAREFLEGLKEKGVHMTVATSTDRPLIELAFARLGIAGYFDRIFTCSQVKAGKDRPDIFLQASVSMASSPEETLVFEDSLHAINTCVDLGYKTVGIYDASSMKNQEIIKKKATIYLTRFEKFGTFWETVK